MKRVTIEECAGWQVARLREMGGLTQDDLAMSAQRLGFAWGRSSITALEAGKRELTAAEFFALPIIALDALSAVHPDGWQGAVRQWGDDLQPAAFVQLDRSEDLELDEGCTVPRGVVAGWFVSGKAKMVRPPVRSRSAPSMVAGEAERKLARALGLEPGDVVAAAVKRWGRSLTEERDARTGALVDENTPRRTVQARRGRVTRQLIAELNLKRKA
jgi:hypothetical protein